MALLVEGKPLSAEELKAFLLFIRQHGILQFLNVWKRLKDLENDGFKYGDEIESGVFVVDPEQKTVKLSVRAAEVCCPPLNHWLESSLCISPSSTTRSSPFLTLLLLPLTIAIPSFVYWRTDSSKAH